MATEKEPEVEMNFDLPEPPPGPKAAKPKIHLSDNACVSCEG